MPTNHPVREGEGISSISERYKTTAALILGEPGNKKLVELRSDLNVLLPAVDVLVIPDPRPRQEVRGTDHRHRFVLQERTVRLEIQLLADGMPRNTVGYTLTVDGVTRKGSTDDKGFLRETVPCGLREALLVVKDGDHPAEKYKLQPGALFPLSDLNDTRAIQQRLFNLGFELPLPMSGVLDDETQQAIANFQRWRELKITGAPDEPTCHELFELHNTPRSLPEVEL